MLPIPEFSTGLTPWAPRPGHSHSPVTQMVFMGSMEQILLPQLRAWVRNNPTEFYHEVRARTEDAERHHPRKIGLDAFDYIKLVNVGKSLWPMPRRLSFALRTFAMARNATAHCVSPLDWSDMDLKNYLKAAFIFLEEFAGSPKGVREALNLGSWLLYKGASESLGESKACSSVTKPMRSPFSPLEKLANNVLGKRKWDHVEKTAYINTDLKDLRSALLVQFTDLDKVDSATCHGRYPEASPGCHPHPDHAPEPKKPQITLHSHEGPRWRRTFVEIKVEDSPVSWKRQRLD